MVDYSRFARIGLSEDEQSDSEEEHEARTPLQGPQALTPAGVAASLPTSDAEVAVPQQCCAFCYTALTAAAAKRCGKCHKRVFCSRECQLQDWKCGHKHWCGVAGEIDHDFEIREASGKGLGIFAKRAFERCEVVMMERPALRLPDLGRLSGAQPPASVVDAAMALMPHGKDMKAKFNLNAMGCGEHAESGLFVRMSYLNHACLPNALHHFVEAHGVKIISTSKKIEAGEEITISYISFEADALLSRLFGADRSKLMLTKWGFACSCPACVDSFWAEKLKRMRELDEAILQCGQNLQFDRGIRCAKALLKLYDEAGEHPATYARTYYDLFQLSIARKATLGQALPYIKLALQNRKLLVGNGADETVKGYERLIKTPSSHMGYLIGERRW